MIVCGERCQSMFQQFLQNASDSEELKLTFGNRDIEEINLGAWSLAVGNFQTVRLHQRWRNHVEEHLEDNFENKAENKAFCMSTKRCAYS